MSKDDGARIYCLHAENRKKRSLVTTLLFKLNNVPDDEAEDLRQLLRDQDIYFYETNAGMWRVGLDAIWLPDESHLQQARALIDAYQRERALQQQQTYAELAARGEAPTLIQKIVAQPIRFLGFVLAIVFVLAVSVLPFWW